MLRLKRDDQDTRLALTALYVKLKMYDELLALMKEGVELSPADANSHYKLGLLYDFKKDYPAAMAQYRHAIALQKDHGKAMNALGKVYLKTGETAKAREMLEAAKKAGRGEDNKENDNPKIG